jgi:hypothetical protein
MIHKGKKLPRPDVEALVTQEADYCISEGQMFYETPKTWELWQEQPRLWRLRTWRKSSVPFISLKDNPVYQQA